jgi:hypothetical protein
MNLTQKIACFYTLVWVALWLLRRRSNSILSRFAFSWNGPFPIVGERKSQFQLRQAFFALNWLAQIALVSALLVVIHLYELLELVETLQFVLMFALGIGAGMAVLSSIYCFLIAFWARYFGSDPAFELAVPIELDAEVDGIDS